MVCGRHGCGRHGKFCGRHGLWPSWSNPLTTLRGPIELVTTIQWRGEVSSLMLIIACCRLSWLWPRMVNTPS